MGESLLDQSDHQLYRLSTFYMSYNPQQTGPDGRHLPKAGLLHKARHKVIPLINSRRIAFTSGWQSFHRILSRRFEDYLQRIMCLKPCAKERRPQE